MPKFNKIVKSIIEYSGGSVDKVSLEKFVQLLNSASLFVPGSYWLGVGILKNPLDLMILQEIIFDKRPDTIIECGTAYGGSAYYMACLMDLMKIDGKIITIDRTELLPIARPKKDLMKIDGKIVGIDLDSYQMPLHPKIEFVLSNCLTVDLPKLTARTMITLDCDHSADHVYQELEKFSGMVSVGQYIIVEDTDSYEEERGGPAAAVKRFLDKNKNFIADKSREKYGISTNLGGYLLRVS